MERYPSIKNKLPCWYVKKYVGHDWIILVNVYCVSLKAEMLPPRDYKKSIIKSFGRFLDLITPQPNVLSHNTKRMTPYSLN